MGRRTQDRAVSIDDPGTDAGIRAFAKQYGLTFEILHDPTGKDRRRVTTSRATRRRSIVGKDA